MKAILIRNPSRRLRRAGSLALGTLVRCRIVKVNGIDLEAVPV